MDCREELQRVDAEMRALEGKLADQRATIERFRDEKRRLLEYVSASEAYRACPGCDGNLNRLLAALAAIDDIKPERGE